MHCCASRPGAASLIGEIQEFRFAEDLNHSLGELYKLQPATRSVPAAPPSWPIPATSSFAPPAMQQQIPNTPQRIIIGMPGPDRSNPRPENPTYADLRS